MSTPEVRPAPVSVPQLGRMKAEGRRISMLTCYDATFAFAMDDDRISIRIVHANGAEGVVATLTGALSPLTSRAVLSTAFRRPLSPVRTIALIYWHALQLKLKGALYRDRPEPPLEELSR